MNKSIEEAFVTPAAPAQAAASPAVWHGSDGQHWVIAASSQDNRLLVYDALSGEIVQQVGSTGSADGQFHNPVGVSIVGNLAVVVEKGNRRAQVFTLPEFLSLGSFGEKQLQAPCGITTYQLFEDRYYLFVADNAADGSAKIHKYEMNYSEGDIRAAHAGVFGDTEGPGAISEPGDIYMDPLNNQLLIADRGDGQKNIKVYSAEGTFTGKVINEGMFKSSPNGIALIEGQGAEGYWIVTDHHEDGNIFHVLNRQTFEQEASFKGENMAGCTGVCVTVVPFGEFKKGAFFTVNEQGKIAAFSWETLLTDLHLKDLSRTVAMM